MEQSLRETIDYWTTLRETMEDIRNIAAATVIIEELEKKLNNLAAPRQNCRDN